LDWLLLAGLGIMWLAFLLPTGRRRHSEKTSVEDFERRMELLAQTEAQEGPGRWIVTPRKGARFVGPEERRRARARERRRRVFVFLLESIGLTFLIGAVPPLRAFWIGTGVLLALLVAYVWLLVTIKQRAPQRPHERVAAAQQPRPSARARVAAVAQRYVAEGHSTWARPTFNGLGSLGEGDTVHVVVRAAGDVGVARA
jgi:Flp pilus assembly protein TadB